MKVSILGTNGFLSNAIAKYANEHYWQLDMYGLESPNRVKYDHYYPINLLDENLDCSTMLNSDIIIYAIGAGIQSNLNEGADLIYALNISMPIAICNKLKTLNYRGTVVTFGSYFELGETTSHEPATEDDILHANANAPSDYAVSKRLLTRFVDSYKHNYTHWHFILPTIYGPGENPKRLIPYTINAILNNEELHFTSGEQVRQYLYVGDVANVLHAAFKQSAPSGIYNIAATEIYSVREIVEMIHDHFQLTMSEKCFGDVVRADVGMKQLVLNGNKLKSIIGEYGFIELKNMIEWYINETGR